MCGSGHAMSRVTTTRSGSPNLRAARYGYLLALHILLLCAEGHTPSEIASFLFCSRSSVYRVVAARPTWRAVGV